MRKSYKSYFFVLAALIFGLLIASSITLGYEVITDTGKTIQCDALSPYECMQKENKKAGKSNKPASFKDMPMNTSMLGWNGPLTADVRYNTELKWILDLGYFQQINENVAMNLNLSGGFNEMRGNLTAGALLGDRSLFKVTYEYLAQYLSFDFVTGDEETWIHQSAVGAAYEFMPMNRFFHSFGISAYGIFAGNEDLDDIAFNETLSGYDVNSRRIAGGTEETGLLNMSITPTNMTMLTLGGGYSHVSYDMEYEEDEDSRSAIAYTASLTQLFSPTTKAVLGIDAAAADTESMFSISHIFPYSIEIGLKGQYYDGQDPIPSNASLQLGVSYPAPRQYAGFQPFDQCLQTELKRWTSKPVVYATRVLAAKDEAVTHYSIINNTNPIGPVSVTFGSTITPIIMSQHFLSTQDPSATITYTAFTSGPDPTHNYTSDLNLTLTPDGKNNALFESIGNVEGVPAIASLAGAHTVTITATLTRPGLPQPITQSQQFTLTVNFGPPPVWDPAQPNLIPNTAINGSAYLTNASLNTYIIPGSGSGQYTFEINPAVSGFSIDSSNHLVSTKVPATLSGGTPITLIVIDKVTLGQAAKTFTLTINPGTAPVFATTTISPAATYGSSTYPDIVLPNLLTNPSENVTFTLGSQGNAGCNNLFTYNNITKSLHYNVGVLPTACNTPYPITVTATDADTNGSTLPTVLNLTINNGPAPSWATPSATTLSPDGIYGQAYTSNGLETFLTTTIPGHTYTFSYPTPISGTSLLGGNQIHAATLSNVTTPTTATGTVIACDMSSGVGGICTLPQTVILNTPLGAGPTFNNTVSLPNATIGSTYPSTDLNAALLLGGVCPHAGACQWQIMSQPSTVYTITPPNMITSAGAVTASTPSAIAITLQVTDTVTGGSSTQTVSINQVAGAAPTFLTATITPNPRFNQAPSVYQSNPLMGNNFSTTPGHTYTVTLNSQSPTGSGFTSYTLSGSSTTAIITNTTPVLSNSQTFNFNVTVVDNNTLGSISQILTFTETP